MDNEYAISIKNSNRLIILNTVYNLIGRFFPMIIGVIMVPILVRGLGTDRYGMLTLFWTVLGYFGLFDLGIGRATTKIVAEKLLSESSREVAHLVWSSWGVLLVLGVVGGGVLGSIVPLIVEKLNVPDYLLSEAKFSLYIMASSLPAVVLNAGIRGVFEAKQRFDLINLVQTPSAVGNYVIPIIIIMFSNNLAVIVSLIALNRIVGLGILLYLCLFRLMPSLLQYPRIRKQHIKSLFSFGGWLTVSSAISPIMEYMDRFFIAGLLNLSSVAYYVVPYTAVSRVLHIPGSFLTVMFPAFSAMSANNGIEIGKYYRRAIKCVIFSTVPILLPLAVLSHDIMQLWLGQEFALHSSHVLSILCFGVLTNSLAQVPYTLVQARGRPDITARLHAAEVVPYLAILCYLTIKFGVLGTAAAWVIRVTIDALLLFYFADRFVSKEGRVYRFTIRVILGCIILYCLIMIIYGALPTRTAPIIISFFFLVITGYGIYRAGLTSEGKAVLSSGKKIIIGFLSPADK